MVARFFAGRMKSKRTLLYINLDFPPMSGPGIWRALWFAKYLAQHEYKLIVLCSNRSSWCKRYDHSLLKEIPADVEVKRIKCVFLEDLFSMIEKPFRKKVSKGEGMQKVRSGLVLRIYKALKIKCFEYFPDPDLFWFLQATAVAIYLAFFKKVDFVISSGPPHITHVVGYCVRKLFRMRWIMDYRDLWTDDVPTQCPERGYKKHMYGLLERKAVECADAIVTVSPSWQKHLKEKYCRVKESDRFFLIRNGHNIDSSFLVKDKLDDQNGGRLHIHYNGVPQPLSETNSLLLALYNLKAIHIPEDKMPVLTFTEIKEEHRKKSGELGLNDYIRDVGAMPYEESIRYSVSSDVLMVIVNNDNPTRSGTIPAKIYEAMALQRHVLAIVPTNSDVRPLLHQYGNATVCNIDDPDDICDKILKLISLHNNGQLYTQPEQEKREIILEKYSRKSQTGQLLSLIESLDRNVKG